MKRFHITDEGNIGPCSATTGVCPYGGAANHFPDRDSAQSAFDLSMANQIFSKVSREPASKLVAKMEKHLNDAKDEVVTDFALFGRQESELHQQRAAINAYVESDPRGGVLFKTPVDSFTNLNESLSDHLSRAALVQLALRTSEEAGVEYSSIRLEDLPTARSEVQIRVVEVPKDPSRDSDSGADPQLSRQEMGVISRNLSDRIQLDDRAYRKYSRDIGPIFDASDSHTSYVNRERKNYLNSRLSTMEELQSFSSDLIDRRVLKDKALSLLPERPKGVEKTNDRYQQWQAKANAVGEFLQDLDPKDSAVKDFLKKNVAEPEWRYEDFS